MGVITEADAYGNYDYYYGCFLNNEITENEWGEICFLALQYLMEKNKKVLYRLKNIWYNKCIKWKWDATLNGEENSSDSG